MTSTKPNYFPALDGLRLLASINIVMLHLGSSSALNYMADYKWIIPIINAPAFAAGIFYVLAGFLFASKFSDPERRIPVVPFMFSRIAKLYRLHFFHDASDVRGTGVQIQRLHALARLERNWGLRRGGPCQDDSPVAKPSLAPFAHLVHRS